jgi:hypothetical protein
MACTQSRGLGSRGLGQTESGLQCRTHQVVHVHATQDLSLRCKADVRVFQRITLFQLPKVLHTCQQCALHRGLEDRRPADSARPCVARASFRPCEHQFHLIPPSAHGVLVVCAVAALFEELPTDADEALPSQRDTGHRGCDSTGNKAILPVRVMNSYAVGLTRNAACMRQRCMHHARFWRDGRSELTCAMCQVGTANHAGSYNLRTSSLEKVKSSEDKFINALLKRLNTDSRRLVITYGDWGRNPNIRHSPPTPGVGLRRRIHKRVPTINHSVCYDCGQRSLREQERRGSEGRLLREVHQLLRCTNAQCCRWCTRDVRGALNIGKQGLHFLRHGCMHPCFTQQPGG